MTSSSDIDTSELLLYIAHSLMLALSRHALSWAQHCKMLLDTKHFIYVAFGENVNIISRVTRRSPTLKHALATFERAARKQTRTVEPLTRGLTPQQMASQEDVCIFCFAISSNAGFLQASGTNSLKPSGGLPASATTNTAVVISFARKAKAAFAESLQITNEVSKTWNTESDSEGIRTPAGRAQWISSPSP